MKCGPQPTRTWSMHAARSRGWRSVALCPSTRRHTLRLSRVTAQSRACIYGAYVEPLRVADRTVHAVKCTPGYCDSIPT